MLLHILFVIVVVVVIFPCIFWDPYHEFYKIKLKIKANSNTLVWEALLRRFLSLFTLPSSSSVYNFMLYTHTFCWCLKFLYILVKLQLSEKALKTLFVIIKLSNISYADCCNSIGRRVWCKSIQLFPFKPFHLPSSFKISLARVQPALSRYFNQTLLSFYYCWTDLQSDTCLILLNSKLDLTKYDRSWFLSGAMLTWL